VESTLSAKRGRVIEPREGTNPKTMEGGKGFGHYKKKRKRRGKLCSFSKKGRGCFDNGPILLKDSGGVSPGIKS